MQGNNQELIQGMNKLFEQLKAITDDYSQFKIQIMGEIAKINEKINLMSKPQFNNGGFTEATMLSGMFNQINDKSTSQIVPNQEAWQQYMQNHNCNNLLNRYNQQ